MLESRYNPRRIRAVALRVVRQLKRDPRTIGLITFAPIFLMVLFGYALSGEMSGIHLGVVDHGGQDGLRSSLQGEKDFDLLYLGSQSDAQKLISDGRLQGAVVMDGGAVRLLLDASSPQVSDRIQAAVIQGLRPREATAGQVDVRYVYGYDLEMMDSVGPAVLGLVVFFFTFITTTISFLRERTQGTLEKFMVSPLSRTEMVSGYLLGFSLFTVIQSATTMLVVVFGFGVPMNGSPLTAFAIILLLGAGALVLGALFSNFASSEFQVVQFIPIVILPQVVLSGVWWPLQSIPSFIRPISYLLPLTYSSDALRMVMLKGATLSQVLVPDLLFLGGFFLVMFAAATAMLRREVG
ncbi:MAG: ABC transporter permease [Methanosarcinales archaeon]|nr:ABC transporter permease [Methanosarcinales archaeon]